MTTLTNTRKHTSLSRIDRLMSRIATSLIVWNERRTTRNALSRLSDRELEDIGLTRGDIDAVARKA
ncbi:MAG: DUF1127 domain-containing protein [Roseovarius sp.]